MGIEHPVNQIEMSLERGSLLVQIAGIHRFMLKDIDVDLDDVRQFVEMVKARREAVPP